MKRISIAHGVCRLAASFFMLAATVTAQAPQPLVIARQGYFFVGGKYFDANDGWVMSGQMYVEFQIPAKVTHPYPYPSLTSFPRQQELNRDAGAALLDRIGPAVLLTHSQSGTFGWLVADARANLVKGIIAMEPSGPPIYDSVQKGAPDWFEDGPFVKPYGLTAPPLTYAPPVNDPKELKFVRQAKSDAPDLVRCWTQVEPARTLVNLQRIPVLIVQAEASYRATYDHCTVAYLRQAGVSVRFVRLADVGIKGNGHMLMLEKNNEEIAAVVEQWLRTLP